MANEQSGIKFFLIYMIVANLGFCQYSSAKEGDGEKPLMEIVQSLLQESVRNQNGAVGSGLLATIAEGFFQSEGGRQFRDGMMPNQKGGNGVSELISGLGTLWQALQAGNSGTPESNKVEESGSMGFMIDLISTLGKAASHGSGQNNGESNEIGEDEKNEEGSVDWEKVLGVAGNFISSMNSGKQEESGFVQLLSFLPVLMSSLSGQHNIHASKSIPHHSHEQFLPPILENLHEYWDHFSNSEFGKSLWESSGLSNLAKIFTDSKGQFETEKIFKSLENNSLRRVWIRSISTFVAEWVKHFTDPSVQGKYLEVVQFMCNSFLKTQGYPTNTHIDLNRPVESISSLSDAIFKRQFNLKVNSRTYVEPVISYAQEILRLGQKTGFGFSKLSTQDIQSRLSDTLDAEIIEPVLRVNRAFKFASRRKQCAKYVICAVNQPQESNKTGLKPGVTKLASMTASWFLSGNLNIQFWDLYQAAVEENGCHKYDSMCEEFNSEDMKATTEYFHNEL